MTVRRRVLDPEERTVILTEEAWTHIMSEHPEMSRHESAVMETIGLPDHIAPDIRLGRERFFGHRRGPTTWLRVVVSFEPGPEGRVVTAFGQREAP
jgi:hypothetical protein